MVAEHCLQTRQANFACGHQTAGPFSALAKLGIEAGQAILQTAFRAQIGKDIAVRQTPLGGMHHSDIDWTYLHGGDFARTRGHHEIYRGYPPGALHCVYALVQSAAIEHGARQHPGWHRRLKAI